MPLLSVLLILASLTIAAIGFVRAVQYPGRRSWLWWGLFVLAMIAAVVNGVGLTGLKFELL